MPWSKARNRFYPTLRDEPHKFWAKVDVRVDGCWPWTGACANTGYGRAGKRGYAHRLAYELTHGPVPAGLDVCHHCDNPPCCNPQHLFVGSRSDNMQDCIRKGRHYTPFGKTA